MGHGRDCRWPPAKNEEEFFGRELRGPTLLVSSKDRLYDYKPRALAMSVGTALTDRFDRALLYATHVHGGQVRKATTIPYVAHLLAVAATVLEYGGSEDMAIAGLLHDAVEDQGGEPRLSGYS